SRGEGVRARVGDREGVVRGQHGPRVAAAEANRARVAGDRVAVGIRYGRRGAERGARPDGGGGREEQAARSRRADGEAGCAGEVAGGGGGTGEGLAARGDQGGGEGVRPRVGSGEGVICGQHGPRVGAGKVDGARVPGRGGAVRVAGGDREAERGAG